MKNIRLFIESQKTETEDLIDFLDNAKSKKKLSALRISKLRRKRVDIISDPSLNTICLSIVTSATTAALVKGLTDIFREYIRIKFEKEKLDREATIKKDPLIFRMGDNAVSIPAHIEADERDRLLKVVEQNLIKQLNEANESTSQQT